MFFLTFTPQLFIFLKWILHLNLDLAFLIQTNIVITYYLDMESSFFTFFMSAPSRQVSPGTANCNSLLSFKPNCRSESVGLKSSEEMDWQKGTYFILNLNSDATSRCVARKCSWNHNILYKSFRQEQSDNKISHYIIDLHGKYFF